jgi:hypothetical protein
VRRPVFIGIFARLSGDREFWTRTRWRRERNWIPTFSRRIANAFAALRAIHLKAQNGSVKAAELPDRVFEGREARNAQALAAGARTLLRPTQSEKLLDLRLRHR